MNTAAWVAAFVQHQAMCELWTKVAAARAMLPLIPIPAATLLAAPAHSHHVLAPAPTLAPTPATAPLLSDPTAESADTLATALSSAGTPPTLATTREPNPEPEPEPELTSSRLTAVCGIALEAPAVRVPASAPALTLAQMLEKQLAATYEAGRDSVLQSWRAMACTVRTFDDDVDAAVAQAVELSQPGCAGAAATASARVALVLGPLPDKDAALPSVVPHLVHGHGFMHIDARDVVRAASGVLVAVAASQPACPPHAASQHAAALEALRLRLWTAGRGATSVVVTLHEGGMTPADALELLSADGMRALHLPATATLARVEDWVVSMSVVLTADKDKTDKTDKTRDDEDMAWRTVPKLKACAFDTTRRWRAWHLRDRRPTFFTGLNATET